MSKENKFEGQTVLITGGSRGIGAEISKQFASMRAKIVCIYKSDQKAAQILIDSLDGDDHLAIQADISDPEAIPPIIADILQQFGKIDICINNAGIGFHHPIDQVEYAEWQESWASIIGTNLIGPANLSHAVGQLMMKQGFGRIINVSSRGAFRGEPLMPAYGASKAALNSLTQSLAYSLAPHGVFVGAVAPGFVETDMSRTRLQGSVGDQIKQQSPMNRVARPSEVAQAVVLMAEANEWMTGGIFDVNGASYFRT